MSRTCGKRLIVAMAGVAALMWSWPSLAATRYSQTKPVFARIAVSERSILYIQIQGTELRAAMSVEGLQTAAPVKMLMNFRDAVTFPEFTLPVPAGQIPAGATAINAKLWLDQIMSDATSKDASVVLRIAGHLTVCRTVAHKVAWQYFSLVDVLADPDAEKAPLIKLPDLDNVKAAFQTLPSSGRLAIGLRITAGDAQLLDVRKDGQPAKVKMTVVDASGAEIASKVGKLTDFGFS